MNVIMKILSKELVLHSTVFTLEFFENGNRHGLRSSKFYGKLTFYCAIERYITLSCS